MRWIVPPGVGALLIVVAAQMEMSRSVWRFRWRGRRYRWAVTDISVPVAWFGILLICGTWAVFLVRTLVGWLR